MPNAINFSQSLGVATPNAIDFEKNLLHRLKVKLAIHRLRCGKRNGINYRVVTKISSCWVNTTSRRGIRRLRISFSSIFLLFSNKSSRGQLS